LPEAPPRRGQFLFMSNRKAFNFFRSYYEVANELTDKDRLAFYDALMLEQFTGQKTELKGMAKFAYISQQHSIESQINGFNQRLKRGDISLEPLSSLPPTAGVTPPPKAQEKEEGKEKDINTFTFNDFWKMYPNKIAKDKCENKFDSLTNKEKESIKATLDKFISYKPFPEYNHPNPMTYLNQKRWNDVIPEAVQSPKEETEREFRLRIFNERNGL
jgi:hypothetical protein